MGLLEKALKRLDGCGRATHHIHGLGTPRDDHHLARLQLADIRFDRCARGFDGLWLGAPPNLLFVPDRNHDDRADFKERFGGRIIGLDASNEDKLKLYREMSPIQYLKQDSPPLLMIQGDRDTTIPVKHAHYMKEKAEAAHAPVEIMIIKNSGHNWRKVDADIEPTADEIIERTVSFFADHWAAA